jgi:hypothetical protein
VSRGLAQGRRLEACVLVTATELWPHKYDCAANYVDRDITKYIVALLFALGPTQAPGDGASQRRAI